MAQYNNDEIDLGIIFIKIQKVYRSILVLIYNSFQFIIKKWIILIVLLIGGAFAGHYWQKTIKTKKQATLIVQNNFDSTGYVYDAIELFQRKQKQNDGKFLKKYGFNTKEPELYELEISPIVNIMDLLEKSSTNDRNLEQYLDVSDFEEDILLSEVFIPEYKYHRLIITTTSIGTHETLKKVLNYLNSNEIFQRTREVVIKETTDRIIKNEKSIENIDAVFDVFAGRVDTNINPSQIYFKHQENNNLHQLITSKNELIADNEELKKRLILYDNVVITINKPELHFVYGFFDNKRTLTPLSLIAIYILYFVFRGFYERIKKIAENE